MIVLGIETSCDETSAGVVDGVGNVISNVVASQVDVHARYGGIVPEVASRQHVIDIRTVVGSALDEAELGWSGVDVIAVTHGPGLAGSLIIGLNFAKGLAAVTGIPLVGVNHLEGHIYAAWATRPGQGPEDREVLDQTLATGKSVMCLVVSGGHTELVLMRGDNDLKLVGETRDDAAGEAFDKVARVLGLRYPGGPEIQRVAESVSATAAMEIEPLPRSWMKGTHEFSFSGIKTAVLNRARREGIYPAPPDLNTDDRDDIVASLARAFQDSVIDVLVTKTLAAAAEFECGAIVVAGGVAANGPLRRAFLEKSELPVVIPPVSLCTDNGGMIAMAGAKRYIAADGGDKDGWSLDVEPGLRVGSRRVAV